MKENIYKISLVWLVIAHKALREYEEENDNTFIVGDTRGLLLEQLAAARAFWLIAADQYFRLIGLKP